MAYSKTTWVTGDTITADGLNNIEEGIEANDLYKVDGQGIALSVTSGNVSVTSDGTTIPIANKSDIGTLSELTTTEKSNVVGAINEVKGSVPTVDSTLSVTGAAADAKATGDAIADLNDTKTDAITSSASGSIASFPDGSDLPMKSLVLNIEPSQSGSGDPSPTNVRPISGHTGGTVYRTGKNLLPNYATTQTINGVTFTVNADKTVTANGTATAQTAFRLVGKTTNTPLSTGNYIWTGLPSTGSTTTFRWNMYGYSTATGSAVLDFRTGSSPYELTVPEDLSAIVADIRIESGYTASNLVFKPMIRSASDTDATYEPYTSTTIPITWDSAGTVYGGTLNVVSGEMTVTHGINTVGNRSWTKLSSSTSTFYASMSPAKASGVVNVLSDSFKTATNSNDDCSIRGSNSSGAVYIRDDRYTDATSFKSGNTSVEIVYELATPLTYTLTPQEVKTLLGSNNIWTDVGSISVTYRADTKLYVDKKTDAIETMIAPTESLIAPTETSTTASRNYAVGSYLIMGSQLYKVTSAIASGGTITVGTNVTATTIMAEIMAL